MFRQDTRYTHHTPSLMLEQAFFNRRWECGVNYLGRRFQTSMDPIHLGTVSSRFLFHTRTGRGTKSNTTILHNIWRKSAAVDLLLSHTWFMQFIANANTAHVGRHRHPITGPSVLPSTVDLRVAFLFLVHFFSPLALFPYSSSCFLPSGLPSSLLSASSINPM